MFAIIGDHVSMQQLCTLLCVDVNSFKYLFVIQYITAVLSLSTNSDMVCFSNQFCSNPAILFAVDGFIFKILINIVNFIIYLIISSIEIFSLAQNIIVCMRLSASVKYSEVIKVVINWVNISNDIQFENLTGYQVHDDDQMIAAKLLNVRNFITDMP